MKLMIWDLDGSLRQTASGQTFISEPADQKPIAGASEALAYYANKGFLCVGATNQGGCAAIDPKTGKPRKSIESMIQEQQITLKLFPQLEYIYACPDFEGEICWRINRLGYMHFTRSVSQDLAKYDSFRKPGAGMAQMAIETFGEIESGVWMIGDRPEDQGCAESAGINFMWANIARNKFIPGEHEQITHINREVLLKFLAI